MPNNAPMCPYPTRAAVETRANLALDEHCIKQLVHHVPGWICRSHKGLQVPTKTYLQNKSGSHPDEDTPRSREPVI
jgi:hypothetical protein